MSKNLTVRLDDQLAPTPKPSPVPRDSLNETVKHALIEAVERRRQGPEFRKRLTRIIEQDRQLLERLSK